MCTDPRSRSLNVHECDFQRITRNPCTNCDRIFGEEYGTLQALVVSEHNSDCCTYSRAPSECRPEAEFPGDDHSLRNPHAPPRRLLPTAGKPQHHTATLQKHHKHRKTPGETIEREPQQVMKSLGHSREHLRATRQWAREVHADLLSQGWI